MRTDDQDGFDRPRRSTRPRTKDRPDYSDAETRHDHHRRSRPLSDADRRSRGDRHQGPPARPHRVIVGDEVRIVGDTSGEEGTLARIVAVEDRRTVLRRTADDDDPYERPIVANADQLVIVTALADPPPRIGMIDRILVAGFDAHIDPLLCLTKADLASPDALIAQYEPLGVPVEAVSPDVRSGRAAGPAVRAAERLRGPLRRRQVHPGECADPRGAAGHRRGQRGHRPGRHTSSAAIALRLPPFPAVGARRPAAQVG